MVESLRIQNKIWRRIKNKNIEEELHIPDTHFLRVRNICRLINLEKKKEFYYCCDKFRKQRNELAIMNVENKKNPAGEDLEEISNLRQVYELLLDLNIAGIVNVN